LRGPRSPCKRAGLHFSRNEQSCSLESTHDVAIIFPVRNRAVSEYFRWSRVLLFPGGNGDVRGVELGQPGSFITRTIALEVAVPPR